MANTKISELPPIDPLEESDVIPIETVSGAVVSITQTRLFNLAPIGDKGGRGSPATYAPIVLDTTPYDLTANGLYAQESTAYEDIVFGDVLSPLWDGRIGKAGSGEYNYGVWISNDDVLTDAPIMPLVRGIIRNDSWNWSSAGKLLYLAYNEYGVLTTVKPYYWYQPVAITLSATVIYFNPPLIHLPGPE